MKGSGLLESCRTVLPERARAHAWLEVESERTRKLLRVCLRARDTARQIVDMLKQQLTAPMLYNLSVKMYVTINLIFPN